MTGCQRLLLLLAVPLILAAQPAPVHLERGRNFARPLRASESETLILPARTGEYFRVEIVQRGIDVTITLRDPAGSVVTVVDSLNGRNGPEVVVAVAESTGDYVMKVEAASAPGPPASYEAAWLELREATAADRDTVSAHRLLKRAKDTLGKHTAEARREGLEWLGTALETFARQGDIYQQALVLASTGSALAEGGEYARALEVANRGAALSRQAGDRGLEAAALALAGGMHDSLGNPAEALALWERGAEIFHAAGEPIREAILLNNVGKSHSDFANWPKALEYYQRGLAIARQQGDELREATFLQSAGLALGSMGQPEKAEPLFRQGLEIRRRRRDQAGEASSLRSLGTVAVAENRTDEAVAAGRQALEISTAQGDRANQSEALRLMVRALAQAGRFAEAEPLVRQALAIEVGLKRRRPVAQLRLALGEILRETSRPGEARVETDAALLEARAIADRNLEASSLEALARTELALAQTNAAVEHAGAALRMTEALRGQAASQDLRVSFAATRQDVWSLNIDLLMRTGQVAQALETSERFHARSLLEMLGEGGAGIRAGVDGNLLEREREITNLLNAKGARLLPLLGTGSARLEGLKQEVAALEGEYEELQGRIRAASPRYASLAQPEPLKLKQLQEEVSDAVVLEYALGEERSYVWAVTRDGVQGWTLPPRAKLEAQAAEVAELLAARGRAVQGPAAVAADAALASAARRLSDMVLAPAAGWLKGKRLVVVPDGGLQRIPFAMLPEPGQDEPLVSFHEVVTEPSVSALAVLRREMKGRKAAPRLMAVFADPVFDAGDARLGAAALPNAGKTGGEGESRLLQHLAANGSGGGEKTLRIPRLPFTAREAEQILALGKGSANLRAVGFEASRGAALSAEMGQYRYLHFATHGYLDVERPGLSGLLLSQFNARREPQDGFLRVNDIYNSRLAADLVVLSACQTGLGKEVRGEGLMGLTRAFLYAGTPRVIVSLWNVNDRATAELMAAMYRGMLRQGKPPAAALRAAQLELRGQKRWSSPYYWAAFVQHGEWR